MREVWWIRFENVWGYALNRVLCWFSCGAASALAAKLAVQKYGDLCEVVYCDTLAYEHPDNRRFMLDVEGWLDKPVKILKSAEYTDIYDVFLKTRWLIGTKGARPASNRYAALDMSVMSSSRATGISTQASGLLTECGQLSSAARHVQMPRFAFNPQGKQ
jgi:hypothetical protein